MVCKLFDTKTGSGASVNEELVQELHKPLIKKFKRRKVYAGFKDNTLAKDLADIAITAVKRVDHCCIIHAISKSEVIHLLESSVLDDREYIFNVYQRNLY